MDIIKLINSIPEIGAYVNRIIEKDYYVTCTMMDTSSSDINLIYITDRLNKPIFYISYYYSYVYFSFNSSKLNIKIDKLESYPNIFGTDSSELFQLSTIYPEFKVQCIMCYHILKNKPRIIL